MAEHVPGIGSSNHNLGDASVASGCHAPFLRGALGVLGGVISLVDVGFEGVFRKVVVARAHKGVAKLVSHAPE